MQKKYEITIEEIVSERFEIYAENAEMAMSLVKKKYNSGEFVLSPGNLIAKQMAITSPENEMTEWTEF